MAVEQNIARNKIFFGGAADIPFIVYTTDDLVTPLDLTGLDLEFVVRQEYATAALITLTTPTNIELSNQGTNPGEGTIHLADSDTLAFIELGESGVEDYVYTLRDSGNDIPLLFGKFPIKLVATR